MVTKCSFRHNFTGASNKKTSWGLCTYKRNVIETIKYEIIWSKNAHFITTLVFQPSLTSLPLNGKFSAISYLIELKFGIYAKYDLRNRLKYQTPNKTMTKYAVILSKNVHFVTTLQVHLTKNFFNKSCWKLCTDKGEVTETAKYEIIWSKMFISSQL